MPSALEDPPEQEPMGWFVVNDQYLAQLSAVPLYALLPNVSNDTLKVTTSGPGAGGSDA